MKNLFFAGLFFLQLSAFSQTFVMDTIISGGLQRDFRMYIPPSYDGSEAVPLLFNLHGYSSDNIGQSIYANFNGIADTAGFITVLPNGTEDGMGLRFWNCFVPAGMGVDDIQFISDLIDSVSAVYNIDPNRIYSTGMSNGGFMSHALACELSDRIAAVASVTGAIAKLRINDCDPTHTVPVMQIHGTDDPTVPYNGSIDFLSVDDVMEHWVEEDHCNPTPEFYAVPDIDTEDESTVEHYVYSGCYHNTTTELFKVIGGEHTWPGSPITFLGVTNQDINACKEIWWFFIRYRLDELTSIEDHQNTMEEILITPNPAEEQFYISASDGSQIKSLMIYDLAGRMLFTDEQLKNDHTPVAIPHLANGVYIVMINTGSGSYTQQLIKQ